MYKVRKVVKGSEFHTKGLRFSVSCEHFDESVEVIAMTTTKPHADLIAQALNVVAENAPIALIEAA